MSEPKFDIHISTSADTKGVEQAKHALAELNRETKQLTTASEAQKEAAKERVAAVQEETAATKNLTVAMEEQNEAAKERVATVKEEIVGTKDLTAAKEELTKSAKEQTDTADEQTAATKKADTAMQANIRTLASMEAELKELSEAMDNMDVASEAFSEAREKVGDLEGEIENLRSGKTKLAEDTEKTGAVMQNLTQVMKSAEGGIGGLIESLPELATSFGMSAGAAGILGFGIAALSKVMEALNGLSKDLEHRPLFTDMTFDEKIMENMEEFTGLIEEQRDAVRERNEALRESATAVSEALKLEEARRAFEREVEDEDFVSTGDPVRDIAIKRDLALKRSTEDAELRAMDRSNQLETGRSEQANLDQAAAVAKDRSDEQSKLVIGLKQHAALKAALKYAGNAHMLASSNAGDGSLREWAMSGILDSIPGLKRIVADLRNPISGAQRAKYEKMLESTPMPPGFEPTGDEEKDEERLRDLFAKQVEKEDALGEESERAAREAASYKTKQATLETKLAAAADLDGRKTAREQGKIRDRADKATNQQLATEAKDREEKAAQKEAEDNARAGLGQKIAVTTDVTAKAKLSFLGTALGDGQGNDATELAAVQNLLSKLGTNQAQNQATLDQAVRLVGQQQEDGSRMQQVLTSVLGGLISNQRELASSMQTMQTEVGNLYANRYR